MVDITKCNDCYWKRSKGPVYCHMFEHAPDVCYISEKGTDYSITINEAAAKAALEKRNRKNAKRLKELKR